MQVLFEKDEKLRQIHLFLEGNHIGNPGGQALLEGIKSCPEDQKLQKLYVDNNGLSKELAMALGKAVHSATLIGDGGLLLRFVLPNCGNTSQRKIQRKPVSRS